MKKRRIAVAVASRIRLQRLVFVLEALDDRAAVSFRRTSLKT
jgi:hypothetical protein